MSIKWKLILIIVGILLIIGLPASFFIYWQNNQILNNHANSDIKSSISYTFGLINFYLSGVENNLTNLAKDPEALSALQSKDKAELLSISQKMAVVSKTVNTIENIALFEVDSLVCRVVASNEAGQSAVGRDFSDRDYCRGIVDTKETYLSSAYISTIDKTPVLGLVVPVKNNSGEMLGFIYGAVNINYLRGYLWDLQENSKVELLDRYGVMFLNTEEKIVELGILSDEERSELSEITLNLEKDITEGIFQDEDNFVGYSFDGSLTVIFEKSTTDLMSLARNLNLIMTLSLLAAVILSIIFVYIFVGRITRRISKLSQIAQEISGGKFDVKLNEKDIVANDETAILTRSFYEMASKLTDVYHNLDQKVKERTDELERSKKELRLSLDKSERINNLMVGRELEMIKLKKEIIELESPKKIT